MNYLKIALVIGWAWLQTALIKLKAKVKKEPWIIPAILSLILSSVFGVALWPPPSLEAYQTIISITGIAGIEGAFVRSAFGIFAAFGWVWKQGKVKLVSYALALACCLFLALGFGAEGQGFALGKWLVPVICGVPALFTALPRKEPKKADKEEAENA